MRIMGLLLGLAAAVGSTAQAATQVWWTATGDNPASAVITQGAPGGMLDLHCQATALPTICSWTIAMQMNASEPEARITGWANNYSSPSDPKPAISNMNINSSLFDATPTAGTPGTGDDLWVNSFAGALPGVEGLNLELAKFTLTMNAVVPSNQPGGDQWAIFTTVGWYEWGCMSYYGPGGDPTGGPFCEANASYPYVQFGANAPLLAQVGAFAPLPIIQGTTMLIPEPTSLASLGVLLAGWRRRRRA